MDIAAWCTRVVGYSLESGSPYRMLCCLMKGGREPGLRTDSGERAEGRVEEEVAAAAAAGPANLELAPLES